MNKGCVQLAFASVLLFPVILASCDVLHDPDEIIFTEGDHVVVYYHADMENPERFTALAGEADQAWREVLAITGLRITATPRIFVLEEGTSRIDHGVSEYFMVDNTVHLSSHMFSWSPEQRAHLLRHELTHLAVYMYYGLSESFILVEGIAEYVEYSGDYPHMLEPFDRWAILTALPLTYSELLQKGSTPPESLSYYYRLAGSFASYIIGTYSMEAYLYLYRGFDRLHPDASYQAITGQTMEEMYVEFYYFE